jgi:hypothetical protein
MSLFNVVNDQAQFDAASPVSSDVHGAGIRFTQAGAARVTTTAGTFFNQGIPMSASGQVAIVDATAGLPADTTYLNGLPISGNKVCVSRNARSVVSNGLPFDSNGAIAGAINFDLNFIGTDTLDPQVTFTRASTATYFNSAGVLTSAATNVPRFDYNPSTLAARGLLIEEQRTNLVLWSEDFSNAAWSPTNLTITSNSTTSPAGLVNAQRLTTTAATNTSVLQDAVVNATAATFSVYVKIGSGATDLSTFVLRNQTTTTNLLSISFNYSTGAITYNTGSSGASATDVGNGWWRIVLTATSGITAGNAIRGYVGAAGGVQPAGVFIFAWGAQLEAGSFATSYIPTVASQVTRSADLASVNTLSPWHNAAEGTLFAQYSVVGYNAGASNAAASFNDGTTANFIVVRTITSATQPNFTVRTSAVSESLDVAAAIPVNTTVKSAGAYRVNDFAFSANGSAVVTDTSGSVPVVSAFSIGSTVGVTNVLNGHLRRITYYPRRFSNAELQAITA